MRPHQRCAIQSHQLAKAAADAVTLHGGTDLPRNRETDAQRPQIVARAALDHEARRCDAERRGRSEKIRPLPQSVHVAKILTMMSQALSFLRPRARRAARTLRPPAVASRARN